MHLIRNSLAGSVLALAVTPLAAVNIAAFDTNYTESFDTLAAATSDVVPAGWAFSESGSGANSTYGAGSGGSSTGNTYSFGATGSTERAFGALRTSSVTSTIGTVVTNGTDGSIAALVIDFVTEQWRLGAVSRVDRMDFSYSLDASSLTTGTWIDVDALDSLSPVTTGDTGALDGNAVENRSAVSHTITGLSLAPGASLWMRWVDADASGSDDGLALDDFSIAAQPATGGGGGGEGEGDAESVPDTLPTGVAAASLLGGMCVLASRRQRASRAVTGLKA